MTAPSAKWGICCKQHIHASAKEHPNEIDRAGNRSPRRLASAQNLTVRATTIPRSGLVQWRLSFMKDRRHSTAMHLLQAGVDITLIAPCGLDMRTQRQPTCT